MTEIAETTPRAVPATLAANRVVRADPSWVTLAAFLVATALLGANWVAVRMSNIELAPFWGASIRFTAASLILFAVARAGTIALPRTRALAGAVLYGVSGYGVNFALVYWALVWLPAGTVAVIFAAFPLVQLLLAALARAERATRGNTIGALVVIPGIAVVFGEQLGGVAPPVALAATALALVAAAIAGVTVKTFPSTHPVATNAIGTGCGAVILLVLSLVAGEPWLMPTSPGTQLAVVYLVLSTAAFVVLLTYVIIRWTPSAAAYITVLAPVVTFALGGAIGGESFSSAFYAGTAVVCTGTLLGLMIGRRRTG